MTRAATLLSLVLVFAGCAPAPVPEAFPQERADAWVERYALHDAAGVAALYTEDAQLLPPDAEIVNGRAAIQEFFARENPPGSAGIEIATVETLVLGDHAYRQGSIRFKGPDGEAVAAGKFIELWKKVDGEWLIHRDIWSANAPPPAAPAAAGDEPA
ncbi:MAG TPA: DUF4440 domain-containing protein [Steroidobacteraceae bacterium]|jgi:uncharacterized protein (TIGR02246 family)